MLVKSEAPNDKSLPVFGESDVVGSVEVELDNGRMKSVGGVVVSVQKFRIWLEANGNIKIFWGSGMRELLRSLGFSS